MATKKKTSSLSKQFPTDFGDRSEYQVFDEVGDHVGDYTDMDEAERTETEELEEGNSVYVYKLVPYAVITKGVTTIKKV